MRLDRSPGGSATLPSPGGLGSVTLLRAVFLIQPAEQRLSLSLNDLRDCMCVQVDLHSLKKMQTCNHVSTTMTLCIVVNGVKHHHVNVHMTSLLLWI